jgi:hypothetical protein
MANETQITQIPSGDEVQHTNTRMLGEWQMPETVDEDRRILETDDR